MSINTVQVLLTEESQWAVEVSGWNNARITYPSRRAAIDAGIRAAMEHDAVLMIHGAADEPLGLDFRDCSTPSV